jgi:hypothetical protein
MAKKIKKYQVEMDDTLTDEMKSYVRQQLQIETAELDFNVPVISYLTQYVDRREVKLKNAYQHAYNHYDIVDDTYYPSIKERLDFINKELEALKLLRKFINELKKGTN